MSGARFRSLVVLSVWKTAKCIRPKLKLAGAQTVRLWAHNAVFHALRTTQLLQMRPRHDVSPAGCGMRTGIRLRGFVWLSYIYKF